MLPSRDSRDRCTVDRLYRASSNLKGLGSNYLTFQESSKAPVKVRLLTYGPIYSVTKYSQGRGRGRQVVSTAKTADLILIMLDATKSDEQRRLLEIELDAVGIRLNKKKPDVVFKRKTTGGVRPILGYRASCH